MFVTEGFTFYLLTFEGISLICIYLQEREMEKNEKEYCLIKKKDFLTDVVTFLEVLLMQRSHTVKEADWDS